MLLSNIPTKVCIDFEVKWSGGRESGGRESGGRESGGA